MPWSRIIRLLCCGLLATSFARSGQEAHATVSVPEQLGLNDEYVCFDAETDSAVPALVRIDQLHLQGCTRDALRLTLRELKVEQALTNLTSEKLARATLSALGISDQIEEQPSENSYEQRTNLSTFSLPQLSETQDFIACSVNSEKPYFSDEFEPRNRFEELLRQAFIYELSNKTINADEFPLLLRLIDLLLARGERDLARPLLEYTLNIARCDGLTDVLPELYYRQGKIRRAKAHRLENSSSDFSGGPRDAYQKAIESFGQVAQLPGATQSLRKRAHIAHLRTQLHQLQYDSARKSDGDVVYNERDRFKTKLNNISFAIRRELEQQQSDLLDSQLNPNRLNIASSLKLIEDLACVRMLSQAYSDLNSQPSSDTIPLERRCRSPEGWGGESNLTHPVTMDEIENYLDPIVEKLDSLTQTSSASPFYQFIDLRLYAEASILKSEFLEWNGNDKKAKEWAIFSLEIIQIIGSKSLMDAKDLSLRPLWQLGRIEYRQGRTQDALHYYNAATSLLEQLRREIATLNSNLRYNFRDAVEPLYREYLAILLPKLSTDSASTSIICQRQQDNNDVPPANTSAEPAECYSFREAIETLQSIQLAELSNFLGEACQIVSDFSLSKLEPDDRVAVVMTIVLPDRVEILTTISISESQKEFHRFSILKNQKQSTQLLQKVTEKLNQAEQNTLEEEISTVYHTFFRSAIDIISQHNIDTIAFIPDGEFRNLPLGILYSKDESSYLIEKYQVAVVPSFNLLLDDESKTLNQRSDLFVLAAGMSNFQNVYDDSIETRLNNNTALTDTRLTRGSGLFNFDFLKYVLDEVDGIQDIFSGQSIVLKDTEKDEEFTSFRLKSEVESRLYNIVHIASHGVFSPISEETFIVAADGNIPLDVLGSLLNVNDPTRINDLDLVVLSACQTAEGNNRATLGMAGTSLRAGARSTIGSLWNVNDQSTSLLMQDFYYYLEQDDSKAEALRRAQVNAIRGRLGHDRGANLENYNSDMFKAPYYWSPFLLVGAWE
jgi:CHAT domain-containing protein